MGAKFPQKPPTSRRQNSDYAEARPVLLTDHAKALEGRVVELETLVDDALLMRELKAAIKGLSLQLTNQGKPLGDGTVQQLTRIMRRIQTEANMEKGAT